MRPARALHAYAELPERVRECIEAERCDVVVCFGALAMGDVNASDWAQLGHVGVLEGAGAMRRSEAVVYRAPLPAGSTLEGVYIDDHLFVTVGPRDELYGRRRRKLRDDEIKAKSLEGYAGSGVVMQNKKCEYDMERVTSWGAHLSGPERSVGVPIRRRAQLVLLHFHISAMYIAAATR